MDRKRFYEIMTTLKSAYKDKFIDIQSTDINVWYRCLKDLDYETLDESVIYWISENRYPPTIADLVDLCRKNKREEEWQ